MHRVALAGVGSAGQPLPHRERLQRAFGPAHDLSRISAHVGGAAGEATTRLGAAGYAVGEHVAFHAPPDLRLAAHEAAHVVQQRGGVQLKDNVGRVGDRYEQEADAIADAVVAGRSVAEMLGPSTPGRASSGVQMQVFPRWDAKHPGRTNLQPPCDQRALAALDNEVVELMGTPSFNPSPWLAEALRCYQSVGPVDVHAQFGNLASGTLRVRAVPRTTMTAPGTPAPLTYETVNSDQYLDLRHPSFPGDGVNPPRLNVQVINGMVTGEVVLLTPGPGAATWDHARALGWKGLSDIRAQPYNRLNNGELRYDLNPFTFKLSDATDLGGKRYDAADQLDGSGSFTVRNEAESFTARANIKGDGIAPGPMPLRKTKLGISGAHSFDVNLAPKDKFGGKFSGGLRGTFAGGQLTLEGTARYQSRKLNGEVALVLAPRAAAWQRVAQVLPRGKVVIPAATPGQLPYALVGWGTFDFELNDWLIGSVSAVLDPDGYITSHGILRPNREFQFLTEPEDFTDPKTHPEAKVGLREHKERKGETRLGTLEASTPSIPIAGAVLVSASVKASLFATGRIGPGRVYGLELEGSFSTRPGSGLEFSATGRINLSAWGRLRLVVSGSIDFKVGPTDKVAVKLGSIGVDGAGVLDVRAYAELAPKFERIIDPKSEDANYRISGTLLAGASADLALSGDIVGTLAGKRVITVDLDQYQWHLGSLALRADVAHVLGSHAPISLSVRPDSFDKSRFSSILDKLIDDKGDPSTHPSGEMAQDKATKPAPLADKPTSLSRDFKMNNADHKLWIEHKPNAVIMMASRKPAPLDEKLQAEEAVLERAADRETGGVAATLREEAAEVRDVLHHSLAAERALDDLQAEARDTGAQPALQGLADAVTTLATQTGLTDLPTSADVPKGPTVVNGRYVIKDGDDLDAVRAVAPQTGRQFQDPKMQALWDRYAGTYFPGRLEEIQRQLNKKGATTHPGPQTWDLYVETDAKLADVRDQKQFQQDIRKKVMDERAAKGPVDPRKVEVDVGVRRTRGSDKDTNFADVFIGELGRGNTSLYSAKVHDVRAQAAAHPDAEVEKWIRKKMAEDIDEAANSYGYELEVRRPKESEPEKGRKDPAGGTHPLYEKKVYVNVVDLVWKYSPELIPKDYIALILETAQELGVTKRKRSKSPVTVRFRFIPDVPKDPAP